MGNDNAVRRPWREAIRQALEKRHPQGRMAAMVDIAEKLIVAASGGDTAALKELGDRLDGKAPQAIEGSIDANITVELVRFSGDGKDA